jgi:hypothetical protein
MHTVPNGVRFDTSERRAQMLNTTPLILLGFFICEVPGQTDSKPARRALARFPGEFSTKLSTGFVSNGKTAVKSVD